MAEKSNSVGRLVSGNTPAAHLARGARTVARPYHHGNLRNALIDAAVALVDLHGPQALTLREAARRAGVSQTAPYRHFADRDALVAAVAADGFLMLLEDLGDGLSATSLKAERLGALTEAYVRFARDNPGRFALMFSPALAMDDATLANNRAALTDFLEEALGRMVARDAWPAMHGKASLVLAGF